MARYLFSGSAVGRAVECPASCVLPHKYEASGPAAEAGTTVHKFRERAARVGREAALAEIPTDALGRDMCEALDLDAIPIDDFCAEIEIPLAYDIATRTARVLVDANGDHVEARRYRDAVPPLKATEIPTTLDALEYSGGDIVVSDLKTGQSHAGYHDQIVLGALAASAYYRDDTARVVGQLIYVRDGVRVDRWEISDSALREMHDRVSHAFAMAEALRTTEITRDHVTPGEHCRWCPAKQSCPEYISGARDLATLQPSALGAFDARIATDAGALEAWARLPVLEELVSEMRQRLDARVIAQPVEMPDGSTLGAVRTERRSVRDAESARATLRAMLGDEAASQAVAVEYTTTLGAIEKAAGKRKREVIDALMNSGAIASGVSVRAGIQKKSKGRAA